MVMTHECGAYAPHRCRRRHAHLPWVVKHSLGLCLTSTDIGRRRFVIQVLHEALRAYRRITVRLINYRADGTPFVNDLTVLPLLDEQTGTKVTHFLGITCERPLPTPLASSAISLAPAIAAPEAMHVASVSETGDDMYAATAGDDEMSASDTPSAIVRPSASSATSTLRSADGIVASGHGGSSSSMSETAPYVPTKLQEALQVRARAPARPSRPSISRSLCHPRIAYNSLVALATSCSLHPLQRDTHHPQLITERRKPYKTIHVNAAWCRQCGYHAEELLGMPYSLLLGPNPAPALLEVLEIGLATGRPLTCHAVYFTKTGLPWQAELSMAPLIDDSSLQASSYSVHVLRPVEPTPLRSLADASSRAVIGSSSSKRERSGEQRAAVPRMAPPQNGHAVVSLMGLQTAVQAGHKGGVLAADYEVPGKHKGHHATGGGGASTGAVAGALVGVGAAARLAHRSSTGKRQREPSDAAFDGSLPPAGHVVAAGATSAPFPAPKPHSEYPTKVSRPNSNPEDVAAADASGGAVGTACYDVVASMMEDSASSTSIPIGGRPSPTKPAAPDSVAKPPNHAPPELIEPTVIREAPAATTTASAAGAASSAARPAAAGSAVVAAAAATGSSSEGDSSSAVRCTPSAVSSGSDDGELAIAEHGSHDGSVPVGSSPSMSGMSNLENASPDISENENASPSGEGSDDGDNADSHGSADGSDPLSGSGSADGSGDGSAGTANTLATAGLPGDRGSGSGSGSAGSAAGSAGSAGSGSGGRTGSGDEHSKPTTAAAPKAQPGQPKPSVTVRSGVMSSAASSNESAPLEVGSSAGARTAFSSCASASSSTAGAAGTTSHLATAETTAAPAAVTGTPIEPSAASTLPGQLPNGGAKREVSYAPAAGAPAAGAPPFPMPLGGFGMREHLLLAQYAAVAEVALKFGAPPLSAPAGLGATGPFDTAGFSPLASAASAACQLLNGAGLGAGLSAALGNSLGAWPPIPPRTLNTALGPLGQLSFGGLGASTLFDPSAAAAAAALAVDNSKGVGRLSGPPSAPAKADVNMAFNTTLPRQAAVPLPGTAQSPENSGAGFIPRVAANAAGVVVHGGAAVTRPSDRIMPSFGTAAPPNATAAMVPAGAIMPALMPALRAPLGDPGAVSSGCDALIAATYASGGGAGSFATPGESEALVARGAVSGSLATPGASEALVARSPVVVPGHEASVSGSVVGGSVAGGIVRVPPFLTKLYTILSEGRPDDCAMWCADGRTFRISDPQRFADNCLPRFFKHNKLGSFQQQLLTYGFSRVPNESCLDISSVWRHTSFVAGRPELLENISRSTSKRHGEPIDKRASNSHGAPTHSAIGPPGGGGTSVNGNGGSGASAAGEDEDGEPTSEPEDLPQLRLRLSTLAQSLQEMRDALSASRKQDMQVIDQVAERLRERFRRDAAAPAAAAAAPQPPR